MSYHTLLFRCAICEREVRDYPNRIGRDRHLEPLCLYCEGEWTKGKGKIHVGTFMDRRKAMQIHALSEALISKAYMMQWEARH